jgi:hypothetical protein
MITRDDSGAVVLIETDSASVRVFHGVLYVILDDGQGGEYRGRFDSDLGLSAWHKSPPQSTTPKTTQSPPNNVLKWSKKQ